VGQANSEVLCDGGFAHAPFEIGDSYNHIELGRNWKLVEIRKFPPCFEIHVLNKNLHA
jgi:hypothetical protein